MVATEDKPEEVDLYEPLDLEQAMKFFYAILVQYGGKIEAVSMPAECFDNMPEDWVDRMRFKKVIETGEYQASLEPREDGQVEVESILKPKPKKLYIPPGFIDN